MGVRIQRFTSDQLPDVPGLVPPVIEANNYVLVDDDARNCRVIGEDELNASYVDNNISTFQIENINLLRLNVDNQFVTITYANGVQISLLVGSFDWNEATRAEQYGKTGGVIYPIDAAGNFQFNRVNTPNLVAIRTWYFDEAKRVNDERIEIAEIAHTIGDAIAGLGHAGELGNKMTSETSTDVTKDVTFEVPNENN